MTRAEIVAMFERRQEAWRRHDAHALAMDHAVDSTVRSAVAGLVEGREKIEKIYRHWMDAFTDLEFEQQALIIDGDSAALVWKVTGTHTGSDFMGVAATGRRIEVAGVVVYELREGQIVHDRRFYDVTGILVQAGVLKAKPV
jgi:steroid delta-isomerase-like uncharacterized protein